MDGVLMGKKALQQRLLSAIPARGYPRTHTPELRLDDVVAWVHVSKRVLTDCAHRHREVDDSLQVQLSLFFSLFERGLIVKVKRGDAYVLERRALPAGKKEPPRATIDLSGLEPRITWGR